MNTLALGPAWLDPDYLLNTFGLWGLLAIVFAESGLLIGFFLPGDSLLFTAGLLVTTNKLDTPLWLLCLLIVLAAVLGDQAGYLFGRKVGPALFKRPDSKIFKQENVQKAHEFFEKHGPKALILARFVPIVRTFTPIIVGVSKMNYRTFITYNVIGGVLWGAGVTLLGAALGNVEFVHKNIEYILIAIVLISVVPIVVEVLKARSQAKKAGPKPAEEAPEQPYPGRSPQHPDGQAPQQYAGQNQPYPGQQAQQPYPGQQAPQAPQPYPGQQPPPPYQGQPYADQSQQHPDRAQPYADQAQPYPDQAQQYPGQQPPQPPQRGRHAKR